MEIHEYLRGTNHNMIDFFQIPAAVDDSNKMTTAYIREEYRDLIRASIDYVSNHHDKGLSLERFDESNLVVESGLFKFHGIKVKNSLSSEDRKRDYGSLHNIIQNLLWEHNPGNHICEELEDLLKTLKPKRMSHDWYDGPSDEMLQFHLAILGHTASLELVKSFADKSSYIRDDDDRDLYFKAVNKMERHQDNKGNWLEWYDGSHHWLGPAQNCFDFVPDAEIKPYTKTNHSILRFCRNMAVHLKDHIGNYKPDFTEKDVNLSIMALFSTELLSFHKLIFQYGISHYFVGGQEKTLSSVELDESSQGGQPNQGGQTNQGVARGSYSVTRQTSSPRRV